MTIRIMQVIAVTTLLTGCATSYRFDPEISVTSNNTSIPAQGTVTRACGNGVLEFDYTVKARDALGVLEIHNLGSCPVTATVARVGPRTPGVSAPRIKNPGLPDNLPIPAGTAAAPAVPQINMFDIKQPRQGGTLKVTIKCGGAVGTAGCKFFYRLSAATKDKPVDDAELGATVNDGVIGGVTTANANKCQTQPAAGKNVLKNFVNSSKASYQLLYTATNTCQCDQFIAYGLKPANNYMPAVAPAGGSDLGTAGILKGKTVELKAACRGGVEPPPCSGNISGLQLVPKGNIKTKVKKNNGVATDYRMKVGSSTVQISNTRTERGLVNDVVSADSN